MTQPDGADSRRRDKDALLAEFVAGSDLPVCGKCGGELDNSLLCRFSHSILQIWLSATDLKQGLNPSRITCGLIAVKGIPGKAHDAASFGDVTQFRSQVEKSGLVFDDALVKIFHRELLGHDARLMGCLHFHQNGVPFLFQGPTVRSSRN